MKRESGTYGRLIMVIYSIQLLGGSGAFSIMQIRLKQPSSLHRPLVQLGIFSPPFGLRLVVLVVLVVLLVLVLLVLLVLLVRVLVLVVHLRKIWLSSQMWVFGALDLPGLGA